jgi:hypothetical protein
MSVNEFEPPWLSRRRLVLILALCASGLAWMVFATVIWTPHLLDVACALLLVATATVNGTAVLHVAGRRTSFRGAKYLVGMLNLTCATLATATVAAIRVLANAHAP